MRMQHLISTAAFLLLIWSCNGHTLDIPEPLPGCGTKPEQPADPGTKVVRVSSADEVAALGEVAAGTEIVWSKGLFADQTVTLKAAGTAENPVVLRAEEPGEVRFTGTSRLAVKGSGVVVRDFWWQNPVAVKGKAVITLDRGSEG